MSADDDQTREPGVLERAARRSRRGLAALALAFACGPSASPPAAEASPPQQPQPPTAPAEAPAPDPAPEPPLDEEAPYDRPRPDIYEVAAGMKYVEFVTGGAQAEARLPMIIGVHGLGDRPENFAQLFRGLPRPTRVILPAGILPRDDGFSWFKIRARTRDIEGLAKGIAEAADRMAEFIDVVTVDRPTVGKPVITGFSQGGMLSFAVAMRHPDKIAAAFPVSGWLPPPLWPEAGPPDVAAPPILALHGDADTVVPLPPTRKAVAKLRELGFPVVLQEYRDVRHQITVEMRRLLWKQLGAATLALRAGNPIHLPPPQKPKKRPTPGMSAGTGATASPAP